MSEEEFNKMFANNLREQLGRTGISQKELASLLDVSLASVGYWCSGTKIPRMAKINKMCEVFGCARTDLIASTYGEEECKRRGVMTNEEHAQLFGQNLRHKLYERNMTQADLAKMMKVANSSVNAWYLGQKVPRAEKVDKLCQILMCERGDLLENPDARTQKAYYTDKEGAKLAQEMLDNPEYRALMTAAKKLSPDSLKAVMTLIKMNTPMSND